MRLVRTNALVIAGCLLAGAAGGVAYAQAYDREATGVAVILVPATPPYPGVSDTPPAQTLDTIAQFIEAPAVFAAVRHVTGTPVRPSPNRLWVTAVTGSRLLQIHLLATKRGVAARGAGAAADAMLAERRRILAAARTDTLRRLEQQRTQILTAIIALGDTPKLSRPQQSPVDRARSQLVQLASKLNSYAAQLRSIPANPGTLLSVGTSSRRRDRLLVDACSGLLLGLLAGAGVGLLRQIPGRRLGRRAAAPGLPVLARLPMPSDGALGAAAFAHTATTMANIGVMSYIAVDGDPDARQASAELRRAARELDARPPERQVRHFVLVSTQASSRPAIDRTAHSLTRAGCVAVGLLQVEPAGRRGMRRVSDRRRTKDLKVNGG